MEPCRAERSSISPYSPSYGDGLISADEVIDFWYIGNVFQSQFDLTAEHDGQQVWWPAHDDFLDIGRLATQSNGIGQG